MQIQLTISLLASDRGRMLERCLESIRPLLLGLPSELIIVYTGKSEEVLQTAKKYTDKVIPFQWCDDFSAARNVGLREARGEWFLYLDDDEWFEDVEEILQFFLTNEYRRYNFSYYIQRNYKKADSNFEYTDVFVGRMAKRMPNSQFLYRIHEQLQPYRKPVKYLRSYVHHYGYCTVKDKVVNIRGSRNIPLLEADLVKNPLRGATYAQLVQEYSAMCAYDKAEECCRKGREAYKETVKTDICQHLVTAFLPVTIRAQGDNRRAFLTGEEVLQKEKPCELVTATICQTLVAACVELKEYEKGINYISLYHKTLTRLRKDEDLAATQQAGNLNLSSVENVSLGTYAGGLVCALHADCLEDVRRILSWLPWEKEGKESEVCVGALENWKETSPMYEEQILECFWKLDVQHSYVTFQKALYAEKHGEEQQAAELFQKCIRIKHPLLLPQILEMAIRNDYDISGILRNIDLRTWEEYADKLWENIEINDEAAANRLLTFSEELGLHGRLLRHKGVERAIQQDMYGDNSWLDKLNEYIESGLSYYGTLYNKELFTEENEGLLPQKCRFLLRLSELAEMLKDNRYSEGISRLSLAVQAYPQGATLAGRILHQMQKDMNRPAVAQGEEFQTLSLQMKAAVQGLLVQKQFQEALPIVQKLLEILPEDLELLKMKQTILRNC